MKKKTIKTTFALFLGACLTSSLFNVTSATAQSSSVSVDGHGVREFPELPPVGVHPRVFTTESEKAELKHRMYESEIGRQLIAPRILPWSRDFMLNGHGKILQDLPSGDLDVDAVRSVLRGHTEGVSQAMGVMALEAWVNDDAELKEKTIRAAYNQARVVLASKELLPDHPLWRGPDESGRDWGLGEEFMIGGVGLAAAYDLLYNDMSEVERGTIRKAISEAISGAVAWTRMAEDQIVQ